MNVQAAHHLPSPPMSSAILVRLYQFSIITKKNTEFRPWSLQQSYGRHAIMRRHLVTSKRQLTNKSQQLRTYPIPRRLHRLQEIDAVSPWKHRQIDAQMIPFQPIFCRATGSLFPWPIASASWIIQNQGQLTQRY
jgi:hypothetical protein